jgi:iron complex transport system ATP-binding protein
MEPLLDVRGLRCGYGPCEVLAGIDLSVRPGEFVGLLGPNGSGKTTLLRAVTGIVRPAAGAIAFDGFPLASLSARDIARRVAVVPQETAAAFPFSVGEVVEMGRYPHAGAFDRRTAADAEAVRRAMDLAGVASLRRRSFDTLSSGERQRVLLARALAQASRLLLVDEPTAHLDLRYQVGMLALLRDLTTEAGPDTRPERAVLAVLHDVNLAARYCTRVALTAGGRIVADGPPAEVLTPESLREVFHAEVDVVQIDGETHLVVGRRTTADLHAGQA